MQQAGQGLGAIRIDSGDLAQVARAARRQLDALGAAKTRIIVTGDLDEFSIAALAAEPVDGYGVGTSLVTGSGAPTAALVYKLVARADAPAANCARWPSAPSASRQKAAANGRCAYSTRPATRSLNWSPKARQPNQPSLPARRRVARAKDDSAMPAKSGTTGRRPLLRRLVRGGEIVGREPLAAARARHQAAVAELPAHARQLSRGYPAIPTVFEPANGL